MSRLPPLSAIRAFEAAARHGSFTKAAEELGMTQAAISYQVKILEDRVGAPLFLRQPRKVVLSEAGKRLEEVGIVASTGRTATALERARWRRVSSPPSRAHSSCIDIVPPIER